MEYKAIAEALTLNLAPKTYRQYDDDTHTRFTSKEKSREFQNILNKLDQHIQFTTADESEERCLNFLDVKIKKNNGRYEFDVHHKPALPYKLNHILVYRLTQLPAYLKNFSRELPKSVLKNI